MEENNKLYFIVGIFVLVACTVMVSLWLWFVSNNNKSYNVFLSVFTEPVDGLHVDSLIKYNGVEIGRVKSIALDNTNPNKINVYLNILHSISINKDAYATLKAQGITGVSYIDLDLSDVAVQGNNLIPHNSQPYPEIKTKHSLLYSLGQQAQGLTEDAKDLATRFKGVLSPENLSNLTGTLYNLNLISTNLANKSKVIDSSINNLNLLLKNANKSSIAFTKTMQNLSQLSQQLESITYNTNALIGDVKQNTLQNINTVLLPNMNHMIIQMNNTTLELEQLLSSMNHDPSILIRGKSQLRKGPGE